jgi:hypothetical protein
LKPSGTGRPVPHRFERVGEAWEVQQNKGELEGVPARRFDLKPLSQRPGDGPVLALFYTGITRLKRHPLGSCLTVVCAEEKLKNFGRIWNSFQEM